MSDRLLSTFGQEALLRGEDVSPMRLIAVKRDVQLTGYGAAEAVYRGDVVVASDVAYIRKSDMPAAGDRLQHPDGDYDLDAKLKDDGHIETWILIPHFTGL